MENIKSFKDYINKIINNRKHGFIIESFDTSHDILNVEHGNPKFYYIKIDEHQYRIFVEQS